MAGNTFEPLTADEHVRVAERHLREALALKADNDSDRPKLSIALMGLSMLTGSVWPVKRERRFVPPGGGERGLPVGDR